MKNLLRRINLLKEIPRTGWLFAGVGLTEAEDVAQHSFEVAAVVILLLDEMRGRKVDGGRALEMALVHDMPECLVADFPYPGLRYLHRESKRKMEEGAAQDLFAGRGRLMELWREFSEGKSSEARLVHAADYISILLQALRYAEAGNLSDGMLELWHQVLKDLEPLRREFPEVDRLVRDLERDFNRICSRRSSSAPRRSRG
jgi:putative hydrolase of HD superfamily